MTTPEQNEGTTPPAETPAETPVTTPLETPATTPIETPAETPAETTEETKKESSEEKDKVVNLIKYDPRNREVIGRVEGDKITIYKPATGASKEFERTPENFEEAEAYFNFLVSCSQN